MGRAAPLRPAPRGYRPPVPPRPAQRAGPPPRDRPAPALPISRRLVEAAADTLQAAQHAPATKKTRSSQVEAYFTFAREMGVDSFPPSPEETRLYAAWLLLSRCRKESSLRQYLSAIKVYGKNLIPPVYIPAPTDYGPLQAVVEGARRLFPGPVKRSLPVTTAILRNLVCTRPPPGASHKTRMMLQVFVDTAILLYFTMLRSSSLMAPYPAALDKERQLIWRRVRWIPGGAVITVVKSKTEQFYRKKHEISLVERPDSIFCPIQALRRLRDMRGPGVAKADDPVFMIPDDAGGFKILVKYHFEKWFKSRLSQMSVDPDLYFLHAFRHGSIALALAVEQNVTLVKLHSNHISDCIYVYSQVDVERRKVVSTAMVDALDAQFG